MTGDREAGFAPRPAPRLGTARAGRAIVFGGSSVCLAYAAHVAAGSYPPPPVLVAVLVLLVVRVAYGMACTERGPVALAIGLGASQLALHAAFVVATMKAASHAGRPHHTVPLPLPFATMALAHMAAAAATAALLYGTERRLWDTARLRDQLRNAVQAVLSVAIAAHCQLRLLLLEAICRTTGRAGAVLARRPQVAVAWVPASDTSTWRAQSPLGRTSRRRGPPAVAVTTTKVVASVA